MIINKVTELKIRKSKLDTVITGTSSKLGPIADQLTVVEKLKGSAGRVFLHSTQKPAISFDGLRVVVGKEPNVADVLRHYVINIPGREVFAICAPNVIINPDQAQFFQYVENEKMERSWAAYASDSPVGPPKVFIMTAPVLPYVLQAIPPNLSFGSNEWAVWLNAWMSKFMLSHRYFNANAFNMAQPVVVKPVAPEIVADILSSMQPEAPTAAIESVLEPKLEEVKLVIATPADEPVKIKKKPGRPKTVKPTK